MTKNRYAFIDKVVIVTGAGSGIGREIARSFLDNGAKIVVTDMHHESLIETVNGYPEEHVLAHVADVTDQAQVNRLIALTQDRFGGVDVLVANAGIYLPGIITEVGDANWEKQFAVNVFGVIYLARASLPLLIESGGNIVVTGSVSGLRGDWGQPAYCASKHAVSGLVRTLALDHGRDGVRVNAIAPAFTKTPLNADFWDTDEKVAPFANRTALGRVGQPSEIPPAVLFLASDDAAYITGVILPVDGGTSASSGQAHLD